VTGQVKEILLRQLKHDGECYRHQPMRLVAELPTGFVLSMPRGATGWTGARAWVASYDSLHYFWYDRWYNVLELYDAEGELAELYAHIATPARLADGTVSYIDYELDVTSIDGPRLVDEDEFAEAVEKYDYSPELQARCYAAAEEALALVLNWRVGLPPAEALAQINGIGE